jgi:hypothetical protein
VTGVLCGAALLGAGPGSLASSPGQDTPPKAEVPKQQAPAPPSADRQREPAPPGTQKDAAHLPAPADGQEPPAAAPRDDQPEQAPASTEALSVRYRFTERYGRVEDPEKPDVILQYRVGVRDTFKKLAENAQGAPDRSDSSRQTIFTERAAVVGRLGELTDTVRRYDHDIIRNKQGAKTPSLQGLMIWYHRRPGERPQILGLTPDRPLRESDYDEICVEVFLPQWMAVLPARPARVGDSWDIPAQVARLVWSEQPDDQDYELTGRLIEVGKAPSGSNLVAVIGVSGRFSLHETLNLFNAKIHFTFEPPKTGAAPADSGASAKTAGSGNRKTASSRDEGVIEARGWINLALLAQTAETPIPDSEGRLKQYVTRELVVERRPLPAKPSPEAASPGLTVPEPPPVPDEANSWLTYDDPKGRFHLRHPQEMIHIPSMDPNLVDLVEIQPKGHNRLGINFQARETDPARDRQLRDPAYHQRELNAVWDKEGKNVVRGSAGYLSDRKWTALKRKVYRIEAALRPKGSEPTAAERLYLDYYLVLLPSNESIVVTAMTEQDSNLKLRDLAEAIIERFQLGPLTGSARTSPPATSSAPGQPQEKQ